VILKFRFFGSVRNISGPTAVVIVEHKRHCTMPRGTKISTEVQWIIIQMSSSFKKDDISIFTGVSVQSVERILLYYKVHGTVHDLAGSEQRGKRRHMCDLDIEVSSSVTCMSFQFCHNHDSLFSFCLELSGEHRTCI